MNGIRTVLFVAFLFLAAPCVTQAAETDPDNELLLKGASLLRDGKLNEAIHDHFEKVIASFERKYAKSGDTIYCARGPTETLLYLGQAASAGSNARVLPATWADAYYLKAYGLIELGRQGEAREALQKALALSPQNSQYLAELAHIYGAEKNWAKSIEFFEAAADAAETASPEEVKTAELSRAWRGIGYAYVELDRLDEAEAIYWKCLEMDAADRTALSELAYVESLRARQQPPGRGAAPMEAEKLMALAGQYTAAWCSQDAARVASFFAADGSLKINDGAPSAGRPAITQAAQEFMTAFPDMVVKMDGISAKEGLVTYHWTLTGTNTGPGGTSKAVKISGHEEWTFGSDGLIARSLGHFDAAEYRRQLEQGVDDAAQFEDRR